MKSFNHYTKKLNSLVAQSPVGWYFRLDGSGHGFEIEGARFTTELRAGLTTFFTMAYIIAVNAAVLTDSGATCVCDATPEDPLCQQNEAYSLCLVSVNQDFVTATAAITAIASFLMGLLANLPVAVAPAMGINAYLAYQLVGFHGSGPISYRMAMTAVFVEGCIFVVLSLLGFRQWLARVIPTSIKVACGVGMGLFLTLIGLSYSAGIGAVTGSSVTPLELGGCPEQYLDPNSGACLGHKATSPTLWIGFLLGGVLTALLMTYRVRGAMIVGIAVVSIMSWPRDTNFTYFPRTTIGDVRFDFFRTVVTFHPIEHILLPQDWNLAGAGPHFILAVVTMLYVDILDCTGTLYSMARFSGVVDPDTGDFPRSTIAYTTDAMSISIGSLLGCSPVTAFVESGAGIQEGGRTGLTAMTTGLLFLVSLFFAPVFASIPPWATGGALILVGCMMMKGVLGINWNYVGDTIPAFVTMIFMPFSYSVAYGLIAGLITYLAINGSIYLIGLVSRNTVLPPNYDLKEYWSIHDDNPRTKPWFIRAIKGDRRFWRDDNEIIELQSNSTKSEGSKV